MAKEDWIYELIQVEAYAGEGRKRKVQFDKLVGLLRINNSNETADNIEADVKSSAGRKVMTASNALRGAARRQKGLNVPDKGRKKRFVEAPEDWLSHYNINRQRVVSQSV